MERQDIENIDNEKRNELFAREMTEVILALKGEFAAVSGKDMGYSKYRVSEEKCNLPVEVLSKLQIPVVEIKEVEKSSRLIGELINACNTLNVGIEPKKQSVEVVGSNILLPKLRMYKYGAITPILMPDTMFSIKVPDVSRVEIQEQSPLAVAMPKMNVLTVAGVLKARGIPACIDIPTMQVSIKTIKKPECTRKFDKQAASEKLNSICIGVPKAQKVSIPQVAVQPEEISIPVIKKTIVPNIPFAPTKEGVDCPATKNIRTKLPEVDLVCVGKRNLVTKKKDYNGIVASAQKSVAIDFDPEIKLDEKAITIPIIARHSSMRSIKIEGVPGFGDVVVPVVPDIQKEREIILSAIAECL